MESVSRPNLNDQNSFHDVEWIKTHTRRRRSDKTLLLNQNSFHDVEWIKTGVGF